MYKAFRAARSSVQGVFTSNASNSAGFSNFNDEDAPRSNIAEAAPLGARMAYIAVSRNEELLAEVADREVAEDDRDFAIALGRKMLKRKAPAGWDEIAADRHHAIRFTIHDIQGCTSYTICFSHSFLADRAQAFVQKLALMLDPIIEKSDTITANLIESTLLIILPVLERELERGNSGDMSYVIENQSTEIKNIIKQNIELMLERDAKTSQSLLSSRGWKRSQMTNKVKWGITLGTPNARVDETFAKDKLKEDSDAKSGKESTSAPPAANPSASSPPPSKVDPKPGGSTSASAPKTAPPTPASQPSKTAASKSSKTTKSEPPPPKKSPRTTAKELVGSKLSEEQAARAADLILKLKPHMNSKTQPYISDLWDFFEMERPKDISFKEGDPLAKTLKGKINRQRLLLHPDKNAHPDAAETFKFLEQCYQRILDTCQQKQHYETAREKAKREEDEMKKEAEKRKREEEEFAARAEQIRKEEEEKWKQESATAQKKEFDRQRIEKMMRDKENLRQDAAERAARYRAPMQPQVTAVSLDEDEPKQALPPTQAAQPPETPSRPEPPAEDPCPPDTIVGKLTLEIIGARDLPPGGLFQETNAYCMAGVGSQRCRTKSVPGRNPKWNSTYELEVRMQDQGLFVTVWREGWGFSLLGDDFLGRVEIPFLDLDDWSGCVIGRVIESADPDSEVMVLELKASMEWL